MVILDTSFLFALFVREDDFHVKAVRLAEQHRGALFSCSFLVFQELMTLLMSRLGSEAAAQIGDDLLNPDFGIQLMKVDEELFEDSWALFKSLGKHPLSFVDVSLLVLSKNLDAKVITFDQGLERALNA